MPCPCSASIGLILTTACTLCLSIWDPLLSLPSDLGCGEGSGKSLLWSSFSLSSADYLFYLCFWVPNLREHQVLASVSFPFPSCHLCRGPGTSMRTHCRLPRRSLAEQWPRPEEVGTKENLLWVPLGPGTHSPQHILCQCLIPQPPFCIQFSEGNGGGVT